MLLAALTTAGCDTGGPTHMPTEPQRREMLKLMLPHQIQILRFTRIQSFNEDDVPDGILAVIRPVDRFGDPVKAVGLFYFRLWTFEQASGERKGQELEFWDRAITTPDDVLQFWTQPGMYEFQLAWTQGPSTIRPGRKYVLEVTYRAPWDETMQDEYVLDFHLLEGALAPTPAPEPAPAAEPPSGPEPPPLPEPEPPSETGLEPDLTPGPADTLP